MKNTTLCYIEKDGKYLMLHRVKKENDENKGKYIGIGGHFLENESPYDCVIREAKEETGLTLLAPNYRGIVTFVSDKYEAEQMHLFTCSDFSGEIIECNEGNLRWIEKSSLDKIPMWQGDKIFLNRLDLSNEFFNLKLVYNGDTLKEAYLDNKKIGLI
ncbi:MAG: 8-oxo-dGTP diphosphatase [Clostridia bacterium]|nr:8-oxo-dGTP diphosphatase [Clostridia bacterium]